MNIRLLAVVALATTACSALAEALDLNGEDCEVTSLSSYESVCNSGAEATLTVNLAADETFSGTISGPVKLVKTGGKVLSLSGDNSYTGGTEIKGGWLQALSTTAFGDKMAGGPIQVVSDCTVSSPAESKVCALVVGVETFDYDINCSAWTTTGVRPTYADGSDGYKAMYNICCGYGLAADKPEGTAAGSVKLTGKITGGDVSIRQSRSLWKNIYKLSTLTVSGEVDVTGTFYVANRGCSCTVSGAIKAGKVVLPQCTTPTTLKLSHANNQIGEIDVGRYWSAGDLTCAAVNTLGSAKLCSTSDDIGATAAFNLSGYNQLIDYPYMVKDTKGMDYGGSENGRRHFIISSAAATLTMNASGDALNDWMFRAR